MEASGLGGPVMGLVLVPGLLASGVGFLIFVGLNSWTGLGMFSLAIPHIPHFTSPDVAEFGWAIVIGLLAPLAAFGIRWLGLHVRAPANRHLLVVTPVIGAVIALSAMAFEGATGRGSSMVLFSGETGLPQLVEHAAAWSLGALVLLMLCKGVAYGVSLGTFHGGPVFPGLFIGAAGGMALGHAGGLPVVAGVAMGSGAMCVSMLKLPLTSVLLGSLLVIKAGFGPTPLVIVAVTIAYVASAWVTPKVPAAKDDEPTAVAPATEG